MSCRHRNVLRLWASSDFRQGCVSAGTRSCPHGRHSNNTSCSNFLGGKQPAAGPAIRMRIVCSMNRCSTSMEMPAAHRRRYLAARLEPLGMVAPTGRAFRTPATTTSRYTPSASTTTSTRKIRPGFVFSRTPGCKPRTRTPSTRCSMRFHRSLSIRSPQGTRTNVTLIPDNLDDKGTSRTRMLLSRRRDI
jgi:hypothetical protein